MKFSNAKNMWDRSVLLKTEMSFGGTEVSFDFVKKHKCPFLPFFGTEVSFSLVFLPKKSNGYIFRQHFRENHPKNNDK